MIQLTGAVTRRPRIVVTLRRIRARLRGVVAAIAAHVDSSRNATQRQPRLIDWSVGKGRLRSRFARKPQPGLGSPSLRH